MISIKIFKTIQEILKDKQCIIKIGSLVISGSYGGNTCTIQSNEKGHFLKIYQPLNNYSEPTLKKVIALSDANYNMGYDDTYAVHEEMRNIIRSAEIPIAIIYLSEDIINVEISKSKILIHNSDKSVIKIQIL
jgi:hypothetical protein